MRQRYAREAVDGLAFNAWLRSGAVPDDLAELGHRLDARGIEPKFNPNHDPATGRFTSAPGGSQGYTGITAHGEGVIRPVGGGGTDRDGRPIAELFAPDPYALRTPAEALAHYVGGSGEDRNYYFNKVDTSQVKLADFPELARLAATGKPGVHSIVNAAGSLNGDWTGLSGISSWATIGGLNLRADGALAIARDGSYRFNGRLSAGYESYDADKRAGQLLAAQAATTILRHIPGRSFTIHLIGSKPFSARGQR